MSLVRDIAELQLRELGSKSDFVRVESVVVGVFYTGVRLSTGHGGVAYTPFGELSPEHSAFHASMPDAGKLHDLGLEEALGMAGDDNLLRSAVGVATLNAVAQMVGNGRWPRTCRVSDGDAAADVSVGCDHSVVLVGAFPSLIRRWKDVAGRMVVLDKNHMATDVVPILHPDKAAEVIPSADVVVITGATFVNGSIDGLLPLCTKARVVILLGPTVPLMPEPLFDLGATIIGGMRISDSARMLSVVSQAGAGPHLSRTCADMLNLMRCENG
jgi:uncharacterized protein